MTSMPPTDPFGLKHLAKVSRVVELLIEKASRGMGALYEPTYVRRMANAQRDAAIIAAEGDIEIRDMTERAIHRMAAEQLSHQRNMESILNIAKDSLRADASPEDIDDDWIAEFFQRSRSVSAAEMQWIWGRLLAEQANRAGACAKRTIHVLAGMDRGDALAFASLCRFIWDIGYPAPIVSDWNDDLYRGAGLSHDVLRDLDDLGLLSLSNDAYFEEHWSNPVRYCGREFNLTLRQPEARVAVIPDSALLLGAVVLTRAGKDLVPLIDVLPVEGFVERVLQYWDADATELHADR